MSYSSQSMRNFYPDFVVGGVSSTWVVYSNGPRCDYSSAVRVEFLASSAFDGSISLKVHPKAAEAFRSLSAIFRSWNYEFRESAGGTVSCRKITGGTRTSLHAHGCAMDINPSKNRYATSSGVIQWGRQTDMPKGMITDIEAIRTKNGKAVWQWGGRWTNIKDAMHFQPSKCSPADLATGIDWSTVNGTPGEIEDDEMALKNGDEGAAVGKFQRALMVWNPAALPKYGADGDFGGETEEWVRKYQQAAEISQTGQIDGVTGSLLSAYFDDGGDGYSKSEADSKFASKSHPHKATTSVQ